MQFCFVQILLNLLSCPNVLWLNFHRNYQQIKTNRRLLFMNKNIRILWTWIFGDDILWNSNHDHWWGVCFYITFVIMTCIFFVLMMMIGLHTYVNLWFLYPDNIRTYNLIIALYTIMIHDNNIWKIKVLKFCSVWCKKGSV